MPDVEARGGDGQLERVRNAEAKQTSNDEPRVEVIARTGADLRLGGEGAVDEAFALGIRAGRVSDGMDDDGVDLELFANGGGE